MTSDANHAFLEHRETIDCGKLSWIINHYDDLNCSTPLETLTKILNRTRYGKLPVLYRQNNSRGHYYAVDNMSLGSLTKSAKHTLAMIYSDIDIVNSHPRILAHLCRKKGFICKYLDEYIDNREECLGDLMKEGLDRDAAKNMYLSVMNGGYEKFNELDNSPDHLKHFKKEAQWLRNHFTVDGKEEYEEIKKKRVARGKDFNHEAGYVSVLIIDIESDILMKMYEFFGFPETSILCQDGIMLLRGDHDLRGCEKYVKDNTGVAITLKIKPMIVRLPLPNVIISHQTPRLEYYTDFKNLIGRDVYPEWVDEWSDNSLRLIENNGKHVFLTKKKARHVRGDRTAETYAEWVTVKDVHIEKNLQVSCDVINQRYDYEFHKKYLSWSLADRLRASPDDICRTKFYLFRHLASKKPGQGYLESLMSRRLIKSYNTIEFFPYLRSKGEPPLEDAFNIFTGFPLEDVVIDDRLQPNMKFENTLSYKQLRDFTFPRDEGELNHFLDCFADMVQDPAKIKGPSHQFYGPQGSGKGWLGSFASRILGNNNVVIINHVDSYFGGNFNYGNTGKILKIFEEVSEKGKAFANHDRLKAEQTAEFERVEPKGIDAYTVRNCARYWYFTNHENSTYVEHDDRRGNFHKMSGKHADDQKYFEPLWEELKDMKFLKCAFKFFANRIYDSQNVRTSYVTKYKKDQTEDNLPLGIKFIVEHVEDEYEALEDIDYKILSKNLKSSYRVWCEERGSKYNMSTLNTHLRQIGIEPPKRLNHEGMVKRCYILNTWQLEKRMKEHLKNEDFVLDFTKAEDE